MVLGAFATLTLLTKNSFLDEIRKQYVLTAKAKGCNNRQVLYGHVFRNAMLIVIAGFPGTFIHAFFSSSVLLETIFSLDGLGPAQLREHPQPRLSGGVRLALYLRAGRSCRKSGRPIWSIPGSIRASISKRARSDMDARVTPMAGCRKPRRGSPLGLAVLPERRPLQAFSDQPAALGEFQAQPARLLVALGFHGPVPALAVCGIHRQRQAVPDQI